MNILCLTNLRDNHGNVTNGVRVARALDRQGHKAKIVPHGQVTKPEVDRADILLTFGTMLYPENIREARRLAEMKGGRPLVMWYFDACAPGFSHCRHKFDAMVGITPYLDLLCMTDGSYDWARRGVRFCHLMQGVAPEDFTGKVAPPEPRKRDVIFTGGFRGAFNDRKWTLAAINRNHSVSVFGRNSPSRVYGKRFWAAHQEARVAFVPKPPHEVPGPYWSNRIYMAAATGTPCVVGYTKGIENHYKDGEEVLFYYNEKSLIEAIRRLVKLPDERKRLGDAARERTLREHTYDERVKVLMRTVESRSAKIGPGGNHGNRMV